ncbi:MAG: DUF192 domain-containing protein [Hansschlegelia sp.]
MQLRMRLSVALAFVAAVTALAAVAGPRLEPLAFETSSGRHEFQVEVAVTPQEREVGLMYRRSLDPDHGMLFDFGKADDVSMWMENTYVSLDMAFVGEDGRVARVEEGAQPLSTRIISSGSPVKYVVELLAGTAKRIGLKPGDRVIHPRVRP